ncbi:putative HicB family RNase H-like nuclease [Cytobacillus eiseniae]|uniref:HicB family RNase H-like nuclease n=1 Tax=Cytobacillus eiseniae TaxID=762947 RepID=A0ABS4RDR2_9BACI|nr:hypothetical protein [Cytobacillus eiseniae]MBP2241033.1 putative HicB family RNase H-like nuclease [Cytobacillus eiseniae]
MKKLWMTSTLIFLLIGSIFTFTPNQSFAEETSSEKGEKGHPHHFIDEAEFQRLVDDGYTKKEIIRAAHIAKYADKKIDDVLKIYKENNSSWEKTAEHFGINTEEMKKKCHEHKEKFLEEHKEDVIENVAEYSGKTEAEIESWNKDGVSLGFIVGGAAMAKASNNDLADLIKQKKAGQSFKEIKKSLNLDKEAFHAEMKVLMKQIKKDIKD